MAMLERHALVGVLGLGLIASSGCYSGVNGFDKDGGLSGGGGDAGEDDAGEDAGDDGLGPADELPAETTRFFRLTHVQWENTVQDLLGLPEPTGLSSEFRADTFVGGFVFDNNAVSLEIDGALWGGYQRAAVQVAEMVASDASILTALAPDQADEATRAREFVRSFGLRAFRRPLSDAEVDDYLALFDRGPELYEDTTGFEAGVRLVLEGMLQSPSFLYRVEDSEDVVDNVIPLSSWEIASRLSYFLWNTMPDDELLAVASDDALRDPDMVRTQALRLLDDPRAQRVVERFHHQMLQVDKFASADPSPAFYENVPEDLGMLAIEEHQRFVAHTVFDRDGSWGDLLTSTETFVNDELAAIYGLQGDFGPDFTLAELPGDERRGLFTQIGFLAANSTSVNPDPIHRGVFLAKHIACLPLSAPPDELPPIPVPLPDETNREAITKLTETEVTCAACHTPIINPYGFPFESYDSTGAFRTIDNGQPVDTAATVLMSTGPTPVVSAVDLLDRMAVDPEVHRCYAEHWVQFSMARHSDPADEPLTERLADESVQDLSVKELLVELAVSRPFLTRAAEEMQ